MGRLFFEADCDPAIIRSKRVAVIGYGSQGHAHALNLRDSGVEVRVGLRRESGSRMRAGEAGLVVLETREAAAWAEVVAMNVPDGPMAAIYRESIGPEMAAGKTLVFSHGFNVHYGRITPPSAVDVLLVAPKGQGHGVRREFIAGRGLPALIGVAQDASGTAWELAKSYAWALGSARAMILESSFREETEADLFSEQAVLCGGLKELVKAGFDTLVEAGYAPEAAYFECLHELKLIADLLYEHGISGMLERISDTAEWGAYVGGTAVIGEPSRAAMRDLLARVQDGSFAREWIAEADRGAPTLQKRRMEEGEHPIEEVGRALRARMFT